MTFFEAIKGKNAMIEQGYKNATHLEVIKWDNFNFYKRDNIVLKDAHQVKQFKDMHKEWDVKINEIKPVIHYKRKELR